MNIKEFKKKVEKEKERVKFLARENYHYARSLGFDSYEARALAQKSKDFIRKLSEDNG